MKQITYSRDAIKSLGRMPADTAKRIRDKINQYAANPASLANNVVIMAGAGNEIRRMRVGDWRVIFSETSEVIAIMKVAPRGGVYE
ncbi:hypothetical protein MesoLjLc_10740 [Mesorhizobium sp. L-8-10]|uniref:type II toxin-antitoxin system RelE family toxin n=1 Tax=Mesorhizobium sp. L-8-10 TaxID=2744523 RepID=UPI0019272940|nr:type II toxin-antitoxin system RelE/ParE family toxin [Mesorhizobium sp. L-8-10]BCH29144.1 hypothetical protein MesoLjLc_10740 [Mesorhizobium sp. L-8-10]